MLKNNQIKVCNDGKEQRSKLIVAIIRNSYYEMRKTLCVKMKFLHCLELS